MAHIKRPIFAQFLLTLLFATIPTSATETKIVCFGDSITNAGYPAVLGPLVGAKAINSGKPGHNTKQGLRRIEKDVLAHHPDLVIVFFGTNDLRVDSERAYVPIPEYQKNLTEIIRLVREGGAKVLLCTLPPITAKPFFTRHEAEDFGDEKGLEKLVADYRSAALKVAQEQDASIVDLHQLLSNGPAWVRKDGVHPSPTGTTLIAEHLAKAVRPLLEKATVEPNN